MLLCVASVWGVFLSITVRGHCGYTHNTALVWLLSTGFGRIISWPMNKNHFLETLTLTSHMLKLYICPMQFNFHGTTNYMDNTKRHAAYWYILYTEDSIHPNKTTNIQMRTCLGGKQYICFVLKPSELPTEALWHCYCHKNCSKGRHLNYRT